jgi:hypothetical protein
MGFLCVLSTAISGERSPMLMVISLRDLVIQLSTGMENPILFDIANIHGIGINV